MGSTKKNIVPIVVIYGIALVVLAVVYAIIPFDHTAAFWVSYVFALLSIIIGCAITCWAFGKESSLESKFFSFPLFKLGTTYTILQNIASLLIFIIGLIAEVPAWIPLVISILLLGFVGIGSIAREGAKRVVETVAQETKVMTKTVDLFNIDISQILVACTDDDLKAKLKVLVDKVKYCDPVSIEQTKEKEEEIKTKINQLKMAVAENNTEQSIELIGTISNLIDVRSKISQMYK